MLISNLTWYSVLTRPSKPTVLPASDARTVCFSLETRRDSPKANIFVYVNFPVVSSQMAFVEKPLEAFPLTKPLSKNLPKWNVNRPNIMWAQTYDNPTRDNANRVTGAKTMNFSEKISFLQNSIDSTKTDGIACDGKHNPIIYLNVDKVLWKSMSDYRFSRNSSTFFDCSPEGYFWISPMENYKCLENDSGELWYGDHDDMWCNGGLILENGLGGPLVVWKMVEGCLWPRGMSRWVIKPRVDRWFSCLLNWPHKTPWLMFLVD